MRKLALFTISPNQEENGSFLLHTLDKLFVKLKRKKCTPIAQEIEIDVDPRTLQRRLREAGFHGKVLTSHRAKKTMEVVEELVGDRFIRHPVKSPDLNIIENVWAILDRKVKEAEITNIQTLKRFFRKQWKSCLGDRFVTV